jgi:membrane protease YdiL (CAAX protease family)
VSMRARSIVRHGALEAILVAAGLLTVSLRIYAIGTSAATSLVVAIFVVLAVVSLAPAAGSAMARLPTSIVLALGIAAFIGATTVTGHGPPIPHGVGAVAFGVGAAVSEELFFRRLVYGWLERVHPAAAIVGSALLFALVHVPLYGLPVFWVDLGAGLVFSWQRSASGGWGASAATHAFANILAVTR